MRIGIDITQVVYGTGVSVYTKNLVKNLLAVDGKNDYVLFGGYLRRRRDLIDYVGTLSGNFTTRLFPFPPKLADLLWNQVHALNIERLVGRVDVFHSSDWTQPPAKARKVTTVHDLVPFFYPQWSDRRLIRTHNRRLAWVKSEVDRVIAPSQSTEQDLLKMGFLAKHISVIPEAASESVVIADSEQVTSVKRRFRIHEDYLLAIGVAPRKNLAGTIKAFEKIKARRKVQLVVVGHKYVDFEPPRGVVFVDHVSDDELSALYTGALVLVYPSYYEGFGIPILDAFKTRTPVVTSNLGSMKETAQDAAVLVDPGSVDSLAAGIERAIKQRKTLVRKGSRVLKNYSWKNTAEKTLQVYDSLVG